MAFQLSVYPNQYSSDFRDCRYARRKKKAQNKLIVLNFRHAIVRIIAEENLKTV